MGATLDAKGDSVAFYERLGFRRNKTARGRHIAMHFDIDTANPPDWTRT